jgi:hypothetical protein
VHNPIIVNNITKQLWLLACAKKICVYICSYEFNIAQTGMSTVTYYHVQLFRKKFKADVFSNFLRVLEQKEINMRIERLDTQTVPQACETSVLPNCSVPAYSFYALKYTYL